MKALYTNNMMSSLLPQVSTKRINLETVSGKTQLTIELSVSPGGSSDFQYESTIKSLVSGFSAGAPSPPGSSRFGMLSDLPKIGIALAVDPAGQALLLKGQGGSIDYSIYAKSYNEFCTNDGDLEFLSPPTLKQLYDEALSRYVKGNPDMSDEFAARWATSRSKDLHYRYYKKYVNYVVRNREKQIDATTMKDMIEAYNKSAAIGSDISFYSFGANSVGTVSFEQYPSDVLPNSFKWTRATQSSNSSNTRIVKVVVTLEESNIDHLFLKAYSYFDTATLANTFNNISDSAGIGLSGEYLANMFAKSSTRGVNDQIFKNGEISPTSFILVDSNDSTWTGPFHMMKSSDPRLSEEIKKSSEEFVYMKGVTHGSAGGDILKRLEVPNNKIQDFRIMGRLEPNPYNFESTGKVINEFSTIVSQIVKEARNEKDLIEKSINRGKINNAAIDFEVDDGNVVRGAIYVDQAEILSNNSNLGHMFDLSSPEAKSNYLWWVDMFSLVDVKLKRRRMTNREVGFDKMGHKQRVPFEGEIEELLVSGRETMPMDASDDGAAYNQSVFVNGISYYQNEYEYTSRPRRRRNSRIRRSQRDSQRVVKASLRDHNWVIDQSEGQLSNRETRERMDLLFEEEYPSDPQDESRILFPYVREMRFNDYDFARNPQKTGVYQYGLEITYQDGIVFRLHEIYKSLIDNRPTLLKYENQLFGSRPGKSQNRSKYQMSDEMRQSLLLVMQSYLQAYEIVFSNMAAADSKHRSALRDLKDDQKEIKIGSEEIFSDGIYNSNFGERVIMSSQVTLEEFQIYFRSYDILTKAIADIADLSYIDSCSTNIEKSSNSGKGFATFTVEKWFDQIEGEGLLDMRNQEVIRVGLLPPHTDDDEFVQLDPDAMRDRVAYELRQFGLDGQGSAGLMDNPATLTITAVVGSPVWSSAGSAISADSLSFNSAGSISAFAILDTLVDESKYDRSAYLSIQKKDEKELEKTKKELAESDNSAKSHGVSIEVTPVEDSSAMSLASDRLRANSSVRLGSSLNRAQSTDRKNSLEGSPEKPIKSANNTQQIQFDPGEQCKAMRQETQQSLIEFQRKAERSMRKRQAIQAKASAYVAEMGASVQAGRRDPAPAPANNESDTRTATTAGTIAATTTGISTSANEEEVKTTSVLTYSKDTIREYIKKELKKDIAAEKKMPFQLLQVADNSTEYGVKEKGQLSTVLYGNIMTVNKVVGYEKDKSGKPMLDKKNVKEVTMGEMATGLSGGKYVLEEYVNETAGIDSVKKVKKTATKFQVKSKKEESVKQPTKKDKEAERRDKLRKANQQKKERTRGSRRNKRKNRTANERARDVKMATEMARKMGMKRKDGSSY